ncbi:MAG: hypothetical protein LBR83_08095 [Clostridiales bacterium]|jgi:hypothetical protein|nr:hypothetical protein [Clostridiales bacterium]
MTILKNFPALTPEQWEKFSAVTKSAEFRVLFAERFLKEIDAEPTEEEKSQARSYIHAGVM